MPKVQNQLLQRLPEPERRRLLAHCEPVQLMRSQVLCEVGSLTQHAYFPIGGLISVVAQVDGHAGLETALVGQEGMLGGQLVLGVNRSPLQATAQAPGACWRVEAQALQAQLRLDGALKRQLDRYLHVVMTQTAAAAGCLHFHPIGQRLARWLLMSQDRVQDRHIQVTHDSLAGMLGVRRVSVTIAAGQLQRQGLIAYHRGDLWVLDRPGLKAAACSCYANDRAIYGAQFGRQRSAPP